MNKVLAVILILLSLNLAREYLFVKTTDCENISVESVQGYDFDIPRKDWSYYSGVFGKEKDGELIHEVSVSIPVVLHGTVVSNPLRSYAIIEDLETKKQDLYKLGDIIKGAKIVAMDRKKVTLDFNGIKHVLDLDMFEADGGLDFSKILTQLRIKPYFEGGKCVGFQLNNISSDFIKQMGLKDGDVIESINGMQVDDPLKALQILYSLEKSNPVNLGIERNDEKVELNCKVEG